MTRTVPSFAEEGLKRFLHGMDRRIKDLERGGDWRFDTEFEQLGGSVLTRNSAQLVCLSATADSIAPGGDAVEFDTIVSQFAFTTVAGAGSGWTHPVAGVYVLTYEHAWDSYGGGGTIQLLVDGVALPGGLIAAGDSGTEGRGTIMYAAEANTVGSIRVTQSSGSAQTCDATVWVAIPDPDITADPGGLLETMWLDSRSTSAETSTVSLADGVSYRLVATGNFAQHPRTLSLGNPDDILYPSPGQPAGLAGADAETVYADDAAPNIGHFAYLRVNLGSGSSHVEPDGGAPAVPSAGHVYEYTVTGQGGPLSAFIFESPGFHAENNGQIKLEIYGSG